jgi:hypothetical protein
LHVFKLRNHRLVKGETYRSRENKLRVVILMLTQTQGPLQMRSKNLKILIYSLIENVRSVEKVDNNELH